MPSSNRPSRGRRGSNRRNKRSPLFDQLIFAADRQQTAGAQPLVSYDEDDDQEFLQALERYATTRISLKRRGVNHGSWAELDLSASGIDLGGNTTPESLHADWRAARPILFPGAVGPIPSEESQRALALYTQLGAPQGLEEFLSSAGCDKLQPLEFADSRDIARVRVGPLGSPWMKSARLSDWEGDESLRLRVSFGREVDDDAARNAASQAAVADLAERVLPGAARLSQAPALRRQVEDLLGTKALYTQHIAYWNAPGGGALFHHDAFDEATAGGQRGVIFTQLVGQTAWLALSNADLGRRIAEFTEALDEGLNDWVLRELWPERRDFERILAKSRDSGAVAGELSLAGCGCFAGLVNRGPEFTSFLADCGHGLVLREGDALLLPNHSLKNTTMHSVFYASQAGPTYGISCALREDLAQREG
jgi:hypothetical protein